MAAINKQDLINYLKKSPENLNLNIFGTMLDDFRNTYETGEVVHDYTITNGTLRSATFTIKNLTVTIPNDVTAIGDGVFSGETALTKITIPNSVTIIGRDAFNGCEALTDIYYTGTQTEWETIRLENAKIPEDVVIHYEYTPSN